MDPKLEMQDKIVGFVGMVLGVYFLQALFRRLFFGKKQPPLEPGAIECRKCRYYLVPADTVCPKCHTPVSPDDTRSDLKQ